MTDHAVCRYLAAADHVCQTSYGAPLREGQTCHAEAAAQLQTLLRSALPPDVERRVNLDLARQDAMAADADARLEACEHWGY